MKDLSDLPKAKGGRSGLLPDAEPRFIQCLVEAWAQDHDENKPTAMGTKFRHSDAGGCGRAITYTAAGIPASDPMDLSGVWNVGLGQRLHDLWQAALLAKYPGAEIEVKVRTQGADGSGHIDAVIDIKETDHDGPLDAASVLAQGQAESGDGMLGLDGSDVQDGVRGAGDGPASVAGAQAELRDVPGSDSGGAGDRPPLSSAGVREPGSPGGGDDGGEQPPGDGLRGQERSQDELPAGSPVHTGEHTEQDQRGVAVSGVSDVRPRPKAPGTRRIAYELKSIGGWGMKAAIGLAKGGAEGPKTSHLLQASLNGLGVDADEVVIGYLSKEAVSIGIAESKRLSELERFCAEWTFTREQYEPLAVAEAERIAGLLALVEDGKLGRRNVPHDMDRAAEIMDPATGGWTIEQDGKIVEAKRYWGCDYCKFRSLCVRTEPGRIPVADAVEQAVALGLMPGEAA